jgi:plasmid stabilization system protein ParE
MKYTVEWLPKAEQELADVWLRATNRQAVTQAAIGVDNRLAISPEKQGESRPNGRRILFVRPLGVIFRVRINEGRVLILHVWNLQTRR